MELARKTRENPRKTLAAETELTNIFNFEPEFSYSNYVIFSCGVNDLSRYGKNAHTLADLVCRRLLNTCRKHSNTIFVFNSIVLRSIPWLNVEIEEFNGIMFELSLEVENLYFFDSHDVLMGSDEICRQGAIDRRGDGVHMPAAAKRVVVDHLIDGLKHLQCARFGGHMITPSRWPWPLRPQFLRQLHQRRIWPG